MKLLHPDKVWSRGEVLQRPSPVPSEPGIYAWYFQGLDGLVPTSGCVSAFRMPLLYVGIAPKRTPENGSPASSQRLRHRIRYHFNGNAEGSTLRLTLGCLLADALDIQLRRVGSGTRLTFGADGEQRLSQWLQDHAFVAWQVVLQPWLLEHELITATPLPLNLDMNKHHPFHAALSACRSSAKRTARELPILA